jgi:hypothetical protein
LTILSFMQCINLSLILMQQVKSLLSRCKCNFPSASLHQAGAAFRPHLYAGIRPRPHRVASNMTSRIDSIPHETRTAAEPRQNKLYTVRLAHIEQINPSVRLLRLALPLETSSNEDTVCSC